LAVRDIVERGYEAFVINRRTISDDYETITQLPEMWADKGKAHRGWDCFVYRRDLFPAMILGDICIGAPRVGMALIANLIAVAESFFEFTDEHLTFHIGDDRSWRSSPFQPYIDHNTRELDEILVLLEAQYGRFPRHTPPGAYLWKRRTFGTLYESWSRRAYLPASWSKRVHRLFGKLSGNS
jgi:hypothetical protein